jgi:hypothetical protein
MEVSPLEKMEGEKKWIFIFIHLIGWILYWYLIVFLFKYYKDIGMPEHLILPLTIFTPPVIIVIIGLIYRRIRG